MKKVAARFELVETLELELDGDSDRELLRVEIFRDIENEQRYRFHVWQYESADIYPTFCELGPGEASSQELMVRWEPLPQSEERFSAVSMTEASQHVIESVRAMASQR